MANNYVEGKVVVITGASSGFGLKLAQKVAAKGGFPVLAARREEKLKEIVESIEKEGGKAFYKATDVRKIEDMKALIAYAVEQCGKVDVLVNNAGTMPSSYFSDHEKAYDAWINCIDVNLKGTLNGITAVYDQMVKQGQGQIINLSSIAASHPIAGSSVYQATKVGVEYLSEGLRQENQGVIKVTTVKPTGVNGTGLFDGVINPESAAGIFGTKLEEAGEMSSEAAIEEHPEYLDKDSISWIGCDPDTLAENILYTIDQPWGVNINEITIRASNERFQL